MLPLCWMPSNALRVTSALYEAWGFAFASTAETAYRAINLHFHDLQHEGGSRLLEAGWPVHYLRGLHESMRNLDQSRPARKQAPALNGKSLIH
jgi:hypothetical protein